MRSNSRENVTVVTTISADGTTWKPTIIFKGQRVQADWMSEENGPPNARYTATDSSFMQGTVFLNYLKDFHKQLGERGLLDGKPHVLVLDGHASHVCYGVIKLAIELDIVLFQVPSHTSHITQPLGVAAFGSFKKEVTKVLTAYPFKHGRTLPLKRDMAGVIGKAWKKSFSPDGNKASFAAAGLWPVDMDRAVGQLQGTGKKKLRPTDRPSLADVPIVASQKQLEEYLDERTLCRLRASGHSIQGLRVDTVMLGEVLRQRKRAKKLPITRTAAGVPDGGYSPRKKSWMLMRRENAQTRRPRKLKRRRRRHASRREQTRRPRAWHGRRTGEDGEEGGEGSGEEGGEKRVGGA